jgi:sigma-E factor negative regulatory protein RseC
MEQQGYIVGIIDEKTAKLKMQRHSACASCGKCTTTSEKKDIVVEVDNSIGAKLGDRVAVNMESMNVLKAVGIAYIFPLIGLLIGRWYVYLLVNTIEINNMRFLNEIQTPSYFITFGIMMLFAFIVGIIIHFSLKKIKMIDSLKGFE